jgi:hypothetical protein
MSEPQSQCFAPFHYYGAGILAKEFLGSRLALAAGNKMIWALGHKMPVQLRMGGTSHRYDAEEDPVVQYPQQTLRIIHQSKRLGIPAEEALPVMLKSIETLLNYNANAAFEAEEKYHISIGNGMLPAAYKRSIEEGRMGNAYFLLKKHPNLAEPGMLECLEKLAGIEKHRLKEEREEEIRRHNGILRRLRTRIGNYTAELGERLES